MTKQRKRSVFSVKNELIKKSQEAALAAIQLFNNPLITFKSESFIVLMNIAWTYLLHAYFRKNNIEYRYYKNAKSRKSFIKTKYGAYKHWELEKCLNYENCPLDNTIRDNLLFLIGIRHEIEHQMTNRIDSFFSAKFQACCINYNSTLKRLFGNNYGLEKITPIALQLFSFGESQVNELIEKKELPKNLLDFISDYETDCNSLTDSRYSYRVIYMRVNTNHENQADRAYRFIDEKSASGMAIHNILFKYKQHKKLTQNEVVDIIKKQGRNFSKTEHQNLWKKLWKDANTRNMQAKQYGELVVNNQWLWYQETWIPKILELLSK